MQLDLQTILAWQQAVTASAASAFSSSTTPPARGVLDLSIARNIGAGTQRQYLVVLCTTAMTDAGSNSTITPSLRTSATITGAIGTNPALSGTVNTLITGAAFPALSAAGTMVVIPLPPASYLQYIDVYFTTANGDLTTGSFSAFITTDIDQLAYYAEGFNPQ